MTDITLAIKIILSVITALISIFVIPYIKSKTSETNYNSLKETIKILVQAAEQIYSSQAGEDKKNYVLSKLYSKGYTVDIEEIEDLIESAVYELNFKGE